jgi:hypothetical protein
VPLSRWSIPIECDGVAGYQWELRVETDLVAAEDGRHVAVPARCTAISAGGRARAVAQSSGVFTLSSESISATKPANAAPAPPGEPIVRPQRTS